MERQPQFGAAQIEINYKDFTSKMNTRLILTEWGFEVHRRITDNDPKSPFKQVGAGVAVSIQQHLGRDLTPAEQTSLNNNKYVEIA